MRRQWLISDLLAEKNAQLRALQSRDMKGREGVSRKEKEVSEARAELSRVDLLATELAMEADELESHLETEEEQERERQAHSTQHGRQLCSGVFLLGLPHGVFQRWDFIENGVI